MGSEAQAYFAEALTEIETGSVDKGLWAMALAQSDGDTEKSKANYIKRRAKALQEQATEVERVQRDNAIIDTPEGKKTAAQLRAEEDLRQKEERTNGWILFVTGSSLALIGAVGFAPLMFIGTGITCWGLLKLIQN